MAEMNCKTAGMAAVTGQCCRKSCQSPAPVQCGCKPPGDSRPGSGMPAHGMCGNAGMCQGDGTAGHGSMCGNTGMCQSAAGAACMPGGVSPGAGSVPCMPGPGAGCMNPCAGMTRQALEKQISEASFAMDDVLLFLDTHPDCSQAMQYYRNAVSVRKAAMDAYQRQFGPLLVDGVMGDRWSWVTEKWPWEGGY